MSQIYTRPALTPFHETSTYVLDKLRMNQLAPREPDHHHSFAYQDPERGYEGSDWKLADTGTSMSNQTRRGLYDIPAATVGDDYQTRPEISQRPPREQLPPLSSLFSASSASGPPPYLDQSPTFPSSLSARDPRRSSVSVKSIPEPSSWEPTNVQRHPSQSSSHYSYEGRPPVSTQSEQPHPPGRLQISRPPNSPRFYELQRFSPQEASNRTQLPPSISGWSPRSDPSYRGDYFPPASRDTSSSFRPRVEQQQLQPATREPDQQQAYRDAPPPASSAVSQYPPTPASTSSESLTIKDGLGPKIWTGTQFLPRYVRSADVPGEGLCYFYDDGTHCKTHIDGETVNAHWGVTKAGKPRKRLAIACITCREKKIKCDPDYPRCIQCEKFGRVCKFKNAPRGGQGSPETPSHDANELLTRPASSRSDEEAHFKAEQRGSAQSTSSQNNGLASPEPEHPAKRRRYDGFNTLHADSETGHFSDNASPTGRKSGLLISRRSSDQLCTQWSINPYDSDEELVMILMKTYFSHIGGVTYDMFPQKPFMAWLTNTRAEKSKDDLMLIYTMLALAAAVSSNLDHKKISERYAAISRYACDTRHFSLQLVQSRLLLALYYFVSNNPNDSWDFCGSALRAATGMKLNQEIEKTEDMEREIFPFNLNRHGFAECRRRTFWCAYLMDRFNGFCSGHLSILHPDDIFLRLPCDVKSFNDQIEVNNPFFDPNTHPVQNSLSSIGMMAYLVNISSIWGDVMANVYRASQRPANCQPQKPSSFTTFYDTMNSRLEAWHASIPSCLVNTAENAIQATKNGNAGTFATIHSLYHNTHMKLNRYVSPDLLTIAQRERNLRNAHKHAAATLQLLDGITATSNTDPNASPGSSPFVGFAAISALDILSAKGKVTETTRLLPRFDSARVVLDDLAVYWQSARNQKEMMAARLMDLDRVREGIWDESVVRVGEGKTDSAMWQMLVPLEKTFARGNDCVYAEGLDIWERSVPRGD